MMSGKIAYIHGSPRKNSTTRAISRIVIQAAQTRQADVTEIDAIKLRFKIPGCLGCMKCHQSIDFACVIGDQLAETVSTLIYYDVIVLSTPTYWMSYPAQVKMLIDRMGSLMKYSESGKIRTPLTGKVLSILATGNGVLENNLDLLEQQWRNVAHMMSCQFYSCMLPNMPMDVTDLKNNTFIIKQAEKFGILLAGLK